MEKIEIPDGRYSGLLISCRIYDGKPVLSLYGIDLMGKKTVLYSKYYRDSEEIEINLSKEREKK